MAKAKNGIPASAVTSASTSTRSVVAPVKKQVNVRLLATLGLMAGFVGGLAVNAKPDVAPRRVAMADTSTAATYTDTTIPFDNNVDHVIAED